MDLLSIWRTFWRHKLALLPVLLLTLAGAGYVAFLVPPVYEAQGSLVLVAPPAPPSERDKDLDPSLEDVNAENPYKDLDSSVVISIVAQRLTTTEAREGMQARGADERYEVAPSNRYGFVSPIVDVTGVGDSVAQAVETAMLVSDAVRQELRGLQEEQGVDEAYMITTLPVTVPVDAEQRVSSKLRSLIAVLGAGGVLAFALVSVLQARDRLREERAQDDNDIPKEGGLPPAPMGGRAATPSPSEGAGERTDQTGPPPVVAGPVRAGRVASRQPAPQDPSGRGAVQLRTIQTEEGAYPGAEHLHAEDGPGDLEQQPRSGAGSSRRRA